MDYILRIIGLMICALFTYLAVKETKYVENKENNSKKIYLYLLMIVLGLVIFVMSRMFA